MGIGLFGILQAAIVLGAKMVQMFTGKTKPSFLDGAGMAVGQLIPAIQQAVNYGGMNTKEKIDSWLDNVDRTTGTDPGAIEMIPGMPPDKEEEFFDHLIGAARLYAYSYAKILGYYVADEA